MEFFKNLIKVITRLLDEPPKSDLDSFIKYKNPQTKEELDLAISQYDEMRRIESRLISRGEYQAARLIRQSYYI